MATMIACANNVLSGTHKKNSKPMNECENIIAAMTHQLFALFSLCCAMWISQHSMPLLIYSGNRRCASSNKIRWNNLQYRMSACKILIHLSKCYSDTQPKKKDGFFLMRDKRRCEYTQFVKTKFKASDFVGFILNENKAKRKLECV